MKPDNCTSLTCQGPCDGCTTSHAIYEGSGWDLQGRFWRWEFRPYLGPIFVTGKGEPMKRQPGEKSSAWDVFEKWQKAMEG